MSICNTFGICFLQLKQQGQSGLHYELLSQWAVFIVCGQSGGGHKFWYQIHFLMILRHKCRIPGAQDIELMLVIQGKKNWICCFLGSRILSVFWWPYHKALEYHLMASSDGKWGPFVWMLQWLAILYQFLSTQRKWTWWRWWSDPQKIPQAIYLKWSNTPLLQSEQYKKMQGSL